MKVRKAGWIGGRHITDFDLPANRRYGRIAYWAR